MNPVKKALALCLALLLILAYPVGVSAAEVDDKRIDPGKTGSLTIYKYDITCGEKDGVWDGSYVSSGLYDQTVNDTLGSAEHTTTLGNGSTSNGYAVKGVEFTYLQIADITQLTVTGDGTGSHTEVLYGIGKEAGAPFLSAIGLEGGKNRYEQADGSDKLDSGKYYYTSDVLIGALGDALTANSTTVKNALETYVTTNGGVKLPLTDEYGKTQATGLPLGLFLCLETQIPQQIVSTCLPFLVSVPMTASSDAGSFWNYDITVYPKNISGIPSLEKTLRESKPDTGKHNGTASISDGYAHTGTASDGDTLDYQIISTLPSITSQATYLSEYTFMDTLSKGLSYCKHDVILEFFSDKACTKSMARWAEGEGKFTVTYGSAEHGGTTMTVSMTVDGLKELNTAKTVYTAPDMVNSGYSDCTLRITYQAKVNSDASVVYGDRGNPNTVTLTWKRTSAEYFDLLIDDAHVYVFGLDLTKQFSDGAGNLGSVEFVLYNDTDKYFVKAQLDKDSGVYFVTGHTDKKEDATRFIPVESGGKAGKIIVKGLEDDTYLATEVKTDKGYTLLKDPIQLVISKAEASEKCSIYEQDVLGLLQNDPRFTKEVMDKASGSIKTDGGLANILNNMPQEHLEHTLLTASAAVDGKQVGMLEDGGSANALAPMTVLNAKGFTLPKTGDRGVWMYGLVGILLMAGSVTGFVLLAKKKRDSK